MDGLLSFWNNIFGGKYSQAAATTVSPLAKASTGDKTAMFAGGNPAVSKMFPGEQDWIKGQMGSNPNKTAGELANEYYDAATAPGGKYFQNPQGQVKGVATTSFANGNNPFAPVPAPTPDAPDFPDTKLPNRLATIQNDPGSTYDPIIAKAAKDNNIPAPLLKAVLAHESMQFEPKYVGGYHTDGTGRGIAGIDKNAHPEISDPQAFDPTFAIPWAAHELSAYHNQEGSWYKVLQRYNGGPNYNATHPGYAGVPVIQRTHDYADNIMSQTNHFGTSDLNNTPDTNQTPVIDNSQPGNNTSGGFPQ